MSGHERQATTQGSIEVIDERHQQQRPCAHETQYRQADEGARAFIITIHSSKGRQ